MQRQHKGVKEQPRWVAPLAQVHQHLQQKLQLFVPAAMQFLPIRKLFRNLHTWIWSNLIRYSGTSLKATTKTQIMWDLPAATSRWLAPPARYSRSSPINAATVSTSSLSDWDLENKLNLLRLIDFVFLKGGRNLHVRNVTKSISRPFQLCLR